MTCVRFLVSLAYGTLISKILFNVITLNIILTLFVLSFVISNSVYVFYFVFIYRQHGACHVAIVRDFDCLSDSNHCDFCQKVCELLTIIMFVRYTNIAVQPVYGNGNKY